MTFFTTKKILRARCPVNKCDGSGWVDLGNSAAIECECQKLTASAADAVRGRVATTLDRLVDQGVLTGHEPGVYDPAQGTGGFLTGLANPPYGERDGEK